MTVQSLLTTKFYLPLPPPAPVRRPRLTTLLSQGMDARLTLTCAPAGFGKTTLLGEWRTQPPVSEMPCAWLSLDAGDSDPRRFWTYVTAALQQVEPRLGKREMALLRSEQTTALSMSVLETIVTGLINQIAARANRMILCLDDYHFIENDAVHESVSFFLDHMPPQIHLVIASRSQPPLPLSRLRGRRQLNEIGPGELRFRVEEIAAFLQQGMGLALSPPQIAQLEQRTEGWIAGLQLAALSLQRIPDVAGFLADFSGSHRHIADYLLDEVLARRPMQTRSFLLHTAILERLCGPLCDAVTGGEDGQAMLEQLEAANLFLVPLDPERRWYRYHHLFTDLLQHRLHQERPALAPVLHLRAADWYAGNGFVGAAVDHALAAGRVDFAADVVEDLVVKLGPIDASLFIDEREGWHQISNHLAAMPDEVMGERPRLCVFYARALHNELQDQEAEARLQMAERCLLSPQKHTGLLTAEKKGLQGEIGAIRILIASRAGNLDRILQLYPQVKELLSGADSATSATTHEKVASAYLGVHGDALAAERLLQAECDPQELHSLAPGGMAAHHFQRGHLRQAVATCRAARPVYREGDRVSLGFLGITLAAIHYEWNQLDDALAWLNTANQHGAGSKNATAWAYYYTVLAALQRAQGDREQAADVIEKMAAMASTLGVTMLSHWYHVTPVSIHALQAGFKLDQGNLAAAARWAQSVEQAIHDDLAYSHLIAHLTLTRVFLAQDRPDEACSLLRRLGQRADEQGRIRHLIQIRALEVLALEGLGETEQALERLDQTLTLAEPEGYIRSFVDCGPPMARLLHAAAARGINPSYIAVLLQAFSQDGRDDPSRFQQSQHLSEPLSGRELEVLRLAADGLSNDAIGRRLHITAGTVKSHLSTVYAKLHVHNRTEAAARARALHLI